MENTILSCDKCNYFTHSKDLLKLNIHMLILVNI